MGWGPFKSSYRTYVGTSVSRVIQDTALPDAVTSGSLKALFNNGEYVDYVLEDLVASIGTRAERMYAYAERSYTYGMPSGDVFSTTQGRQQVEAVIEAAEGQQVLIEYSHYGPLNALHVGWMKLVSQYGYDQATNRLMSITAPGVPVYLKDMVVVVPDSQKTTINPEAIAQWGSAPNAGYTPERLASAATTLLLTKHTPININTTSSVVYLVVTYVWQTANGQIHEDQAVIDLSGYDQDSDYFHAKYFVGSVAKYWIYKNKTGVYPTLDNVFVDAPAVSGSYFPFAYFRYGMSSLMGNTTTAAYKSTEKMFKYLGMDYAVIGDAIAQNPNIGNVEQAMMTFAVPSVSTNAVECRYLFDYFDNLHYTMDGSTIPGLDAIQNSLDGTGTGKNAIVIKDSLFQMALVNDGIYKHMVAGSIGAVGTYTSSYETSNVVTSGVDSDSGGAITWTTPVGTHRYRHQVAPGLYEEIVVLGLHMTYYVWGGYNTTGSATDSILLIPIDRTITQDYSIPDREKLYARSLHFVFNSRVEQEVKWYQSGWFQVFMIVVAIVITIYTYGADGGSTIAAALGLSGTAGLIVTIIFNLTVGQYLISEAFRLFVKAVGVEWATAIAVVAVIWGAYQLMEGGVTALPTAGRLLMLSSGISQTVLKTKFTDLLAEQDQFKIFVDEETKLLDNARELLENSHTLSPFVIFGEKPEDFYNRTVHFGNIGTLGINAVSSYVDIALTLPKFNDTLGEEINGQL